jgi:hypothetical protein
MPVPVNLLSWRLPRHGCEISDAEAAALEGGLRGRLYGERHGGGGGASLCSCGWRGVDGGGFWG